VLLQTVSLYYLGYVLLVAFIFFYPFVVKASFVPYLERP